MYTFAHVLNEVSSKIGTGYSPSSDEAKRLVRQAIQQILQAHPILLERIVRLYAYGNFLVLPEEIRRIKKYQFSGSFERPQHIYFEFLDNGPGLLKNMVSAHNVFTDRGFSPVVYQPTAELPLMLMSDRNEAECEVTIRGKAETGKEVRSANGTVGETIQIRTGNELVQSRLSFNEISSFVKPKTNGYLHLYSYDPDTEARYLLARYAPDTTVAHFRMYRIPGNNFTNDEANISTIDALVLLEEPKFLVEDDIVPIRNILAIQLVARAIQLLGQKKYKEAQVENQNGMALAKQSIELDHPQAGMPDIDASDFMMGDVETL